MIFFYYICILNRLYGIKKKINYYTKRFYRCYRIAIDRTANICKMQDAKLILLHIINKDTSLLKEKQFYRK